MIGILLLSSCVPCKRISLAKVLIYNLQKENNIASSPLKNKNEQLKNLSNIEVSIQNEKASLNNDYILSPDDIAPLSPQSTFTISELKKSGKSKSKWLINIQSEIQEKKDKINEIRNTILDTQTNYSNCSTAIYCHR